MVYYIICRMHEYNIHTVSHSDINHHTVTTAKQLRYFVQVITTTHCLVTFLYVTTTFVTQPADILCHA